MSMKTTNDIIDETVEYYRTHPRAVDPGGVCVYLNESGDMCAVGRCMENPSTDMIGSVANLETNDGIIDTTDETVVNRLFREEYQGHDLVFWSELQNLHDRNMFWESNSAGGADLTQSGIKFVKYLKETYSPV